MFQPHPQFCLRAWRVSGFIISGQNSQSFQIHFWRFQDPIAPAAQIHDLLDAFLRPAILLLSANILHGASFPANYPARLEEIKTQVRSSAWQQESLFDSIVA